MLLLEKNMCKTLYASHHDEMYACFKYNEISKIHMHLDRQIKVMPDLIFACFLVQYLEH